MRTACACAVGPTRSPLGTSVVVVGTDTWAAPDDDAVPPVQACALSGAPCTNKWAQNAKCRDHAAESTDNPANAAHGAAGAFAHANPQPVRQRGVGPELESRVRWIRLHKPRAGGLRMQIRRALVSGTLQ